MLNDDQDLVQGVNDLNRVLDTLDELSAKTRSKYGLTSAKAAAILAGAHSTTNGPRLDDVDYQGPEFLGKLYDARRGNPEANAYIKAVLGTSDATGQAIVPNNFVASLGTIAANRNIFRRLMTVNRGIQAAAVDIPYEITGPFAALVQGAYGSNKQVADFWFAQATATLYTVAQIADVGNQLLRQSGGVAENAARRRLGDSIGLAESAFIINGTGSGQPNGILTALMSFGDIAANKYALNSESRVAALAGGVAKLDSRGVTPTAFVLNPTDYWSTLKETLGSSGSGGWAVDPATGASAGPPTVSFWGLPVLRCADLPSGTGLVADWTAFDIYLGNDFRIDVSSEAGSRFDQNVTGFRAEEDFGFNAEPAVRTGKVVKITGIG